MLLVDMLCLAHEIPDRPGGSARKALHFPASGIDGTPRAMNCCPSGMSSTQSAKSECSTGINSTPHAMSSTRSAIHWLASGIHSTSTAINSTRAAINAPKGGVDSTPNPIHSCRSATGEDSDCAPQTIRRHPDLRRLTESSVSDISDASWLSHAQQAGLSQTSDLNGPCGAWSAGNMHSTRISCAATV